MRTPYIWVTNPCNTSLEWKYFCILDSPGAACYGKNKRDCDQNVLLQIFLPSAVITTIYHVRPSGEFAASLSPAEFSLEAPACKFQVVKHGYGRNLEVESCQSLTIGPCSAGNNTTALWERFLLVSGKGSRVTFLSKNQRPKVSALYTFCQDFFFICHLPLHLALQRFWNTWKYKRMNWQCLTPQIYWFCILSPLGQLLRHYLSGAFPGFILDLNYSSRLTEIHHPWCFTSAEHRVARHGLRFCMWIPCHLVQW